MKYLKNFESVSFDAEDADVMARFQLSEAKIILGFYYRRLLISNLNNVNELIEKYNETYISEKEWNGGPTNNLFDKYFLDKLNVSPDCGNKIDKPVLCLILETDYGFWPILFNIRNKEMNGMYLAPIDKKYSTDIKKEIVYLRKMDVISIYHNKYDGVVVNEMKNIFNKYWKEKKQFDDFVIDFYLKTDFDWEWNT